MGDKTGIEWTDSTWNPIIGCSIVSPGCTNCYAMKQAARVERMGGKGGAKYAGLTHPSKGGPVWTGTVRLNEDALLLPLRWKRPRRIFVNSMSDLFHEAVPEEWIDRIFAVMAIAPQHPFQVLTKRAERMRLYMSDPAVKRRIYELACDMTISLDLEVILIAPGTDERQAPPGPRIYLDRWPPPNVWLGVSAEDQARADERIPDLLATPAAVRFVSAEPLLGPLELRRLRVRKGVQLDVLTGLYEAFTSMLGGFDRAEEAIAALPTLPPRLPALDWVIAGGESGAGARPMHPSWPRSLRDQCASAGVAYFLKQWGEWAPYNPQPGGDLGGDVRNGRVQIVHPSGRSNVDVAVASGGRSTEPGSRYMAKVGKHRAGRLLDGRTHDGMPGGAA